MSIKLMLKNRLYLYQTNTVSIISLTYQNINSQQQISIKLQTQPHNKKISQTMDAANIRRKMLKPLSRNYNHEPNYSTPARHTMTFINSFNIMMQPQRGEDRDEGNYGNNNNTTLEVYGISQAKSEDNNRSPIISISPQFNQQFRNNYQYGGHLQMVHDFQLILQKTTQNTRTLTAKDIHFAMEQVLGKYLAQTVARTLTNLLSKKTLKTQTKMEICSQFMVACLALIKSLNRHTLHRILGNSFKIVNIINKSLLQYLKSKYPKKKGLAVPIGLDGEFQRINYLGMFRNDMLVNCGFGFTGTGAGDSRVQILDRAKKFINCTLDEVDENFPHFADILNKIFTTSNSSTEGKDQHQHQHSHQQQHTHKIAQKVLVHSNPAHKSPSLYKISRKLPESTQHYYQFGSQNMQISSPQLFRVMIKWIEGMEELINHPSDVITGLNGIKYIKNNDNGRGMGEGGKKGKGYGGMVFDEIQSKRFQQLKIDLIQKITQIRDTKYNKQISQLLTQLNNFNNNFIKILTIRSPKVKFIEQEQAEGLKFAKFNSKFLEWLIVEKFIIIVRTLSELSSYFETKLYKQLDFINFNVFDLMRASFSGKKQEVISSFNNLRLLEQQGQIQIIRIKNRLHTPLNDVLINFKMVRSFIICQIQLILVDLAQDGQQKFKYVEDINHILYELERSPYGSMSEMGIIVDNFDPSIFYEQKIGFSNDWHGDEECPEGQRHQFVEIKSQETPFVCAWCVKFYSRRQNYFQYTKCVKYSLQKCKACTFRENTSEQRRTYFRNFALTITGALSLQNSEENEQLKDDQFIDNFFMREQVNFIYENYVKVSELVNVEKGVRLEELDKFMHQRQREFGLKATEPFYCFLLRFSEQTPQLKLIKYENYKVSVCLQENQQDLNAQQISALTQKQNKLKLSKHDVLFLLKKRIYLNQRQSDGSFIYKSKLTDIKTLFYITRSSQKVCIPNKKQYRVLCLSHRKKKYLLELKKLYTQQQNVNEEDETFSEETRFNAEELGRVMGNIVAKCQGYKLQRYCLELQRMGLNEDILEKYLKAPNQKDRKNQVIKQIKMDWCKQVFVLNLSQNYIKHMSKISSIFPNVKQLYLSKNMLSSMSFIEHTNCLKILDLSQNTLKQIPPSINEPNLQSLALLKLSFNSIDKLPKLNLPNLQELYLNKNKINNFIPIFESLIPRIQIIDISLNSMAGRSVFNWRVFAAFPMLRKLEMKRVNLVVSTEHGKITDKDNVMVNLRSLQKIQYLDLSNNKLGYLNPITQRKLRQLKLSNCNLQQLTSVLTPKLTSLQILQLHSNDIHTFPKKLQLPQLRELKLNSNKMANVDNISSCYLPKLEVLEFQSNGLVHVGELGSVELPGLRKLGLEYNRIQGVPVLNFPLLQEINLNNNKLTDLSSLSNSQLPRLKILLFKNNCLKSIPTLSFPQLCYINPIYNEFTDLTAFSHSNLPKLTKIVIHHNKIIEINHKFNFPHITSLILFENCIISIEGLSKSDLGALKMISLNSNKIGRLPVLTLENLEIFSISKNCLQSVEEINSWKTPKLRIIDLKLNNIKKMPALKGLLVQTLDISANHIEDLSQFTSQSKLSFLRKFIANFNKKLVKIGGNFNGCPRLQQITLNDCCLENFDQFSVIKHLITNSQQIGLKNLKLINLDNNKITHLPAPESIDYLEALQKLTIRGNKITKINYQFSKLKSLKSLYLTSNLLTSVQTEYFQNCQNIVQLSFTRNFLKFISLPQVMKLKSLTLNNCQLTDDSIEGLELPKLKELYLIKNQIETMKAFTVQGAFANLKKLFLDQNKVKIIPSNLNLPKINDIFMVGNPLTDISGLLQCYFPEIRFIIITKKKKNPRRKQQSQDNKSKQMIKEEQPSNLEIQTLKRHQSKNEQSSQEQFDEETQAELQKKKSQKEQQERNRQQMQKIAQEMKKIYPSAYVKA